MKIYVGNLPHAVTDDELRQLFAAHGAVTSAAIVLDHYSEKSRGFGFVEMSQMSEALAAIQALNGQAHQGRTLIVNEARPRTDRNDRRGGSGGDRRGGNNGRRPSQRSW